MTTSTFGPGDYGGYNDCAWAGSGAFWTNWNTSTFATGTLGRVTAIGVKWDGSNNAPCTTCTGRNDLWNTSNNLVLNTSTYGVVCTAVCNGGVGGETMHNVGTGDLWQSNASYYIGTWRPSNQCTSFVWANNTNGGYAGKSADDGTNGGGTANWGGTTNGGLPVYGTVTISNVYVKRAGVWTQVFVYVKRAGVWVGPVYVYVKRAGTWTIINELKELEIPSKGMPIRVDVGEGLEPGWIIEEGEKSWFGSFDPTTQSWDWRIPGHYAEEFKPWTGRYNSFDSDEVAEERLRAQYEYDKALRWENYETSKYWFPKYQPPGFPKDVPILLPNKPKSIAVPEIKEVEEPEPILVPCGCG